MSGPSIRSRMPLPIALSTLAVLVFAAPAVHAQWTAAPRAVVTATGTQQGAAVAPGLAKDLFMAWTDKRADRDVYVTRIDSLGNVAAAGGIAVASGAAPQHSPAVAADGAGGLLVVWVDSSGTVNNVYAQRFNASLAPQWGANGVRVCTAPSSQVLPVVASDDSGGAIVAWQDARHDTVNIYAQRVRVNGSLAWNSMGALVCGATGDQSSPRIVRDGARGAVLCWDDRRSGSPTSIQTFLQRLNPFGQIVWATNGVELDPGSAVGTSIACDASGSTLALFTDAVGTGTGVHLLRFGPNGNRTFADTTARATVSTTAGYLPYGVFPQAVGSTLCLYGSATAIRARVMSSSGAAAAPSFVLATPAAATSVVSSSDGASGAWVTWVDGSQVRAQHVTALSEVPAAVTVAATSASRTRSGATHLVLSSGELDVVWEDAAASAPIDTDLVAQRVAPNGVVGEYYRIWGNAGANGTVTPAGLTYVAAHTNFDMTVAASGGFFINSVQADAVTLGPVPNYTFSDVTAHHALSATFSAAPVTGFIITPPTEYLSLAFPCTFTNDSATVVLAPLGPGGAEHWRFGHWNPTTKHYDSAPGTLVHVGPGDGFWLRTMVLDTLTYSGTPVAETDFVRSLTPALADSMGWNQVANPFRFPVAVSSLSVRSGNGTWFSLVSPSQSYTGHEVLRWTAGSGYTVASRLYPGEAYWIHKETGANITLRIPFQYTPSAPPAAGDLPQGAAWAIDLAATQDGGPGASLRLGAGDVADGAWNALSAVRHPASPERDLSLWVGEDGWGARNGDYSAHFRADGAELAWDVRLHGEDALAQAALAFSFRGLPADRVVTLSDPAAGWSHRVRDGEQVPLALSSATRTLRVSVTASGAGASESGVAALRASGPNPFTDHAALSFMLPRGGDLSIDVLDVSGRRVAAIRRRGLAAGEQVVTWDGRDASGSRVRPGVYLARWSAGGRTGSTRLVSIR